MINSIDDLQRQIEMAALIYEFPDKYSEIDLAEKFHTSESSIHRDMRALRAMGITVNSRKRAFRIELSLLQINTLITTYFAFGNNETIKNLPLVLERFQNKTLSFFVETIRAIRQKHVIEIEYRSAKTNRYQWRTVTPVTFYNAGKTHYLIAIHQDTAKMFTIERIQNFRFSRQASSIKNVPTLNELFRHSWGSFTGGKLTDVHLRFKDDLGQYMAEKFWIEEQAMKQSDNGFEIRLKVKLSNEFIAWILGWGDAVTVLAPDELRQSVLEKAKSIVNHYKK